MRSLIWITAVYWLWQRPSLTVHSQVKTRLAALAMSVSLRPNDDPAYASMATVWRAILSIIALNTWSCKTCSCISIPWSSLD